METLLSEQLGEVGQQLFEGQPRLVTLAQNLMSVHHWT